ncbi:MAG: type II toxin-antitoxin system VapB family antitoxin [Acidobacteria bacterium]|nr:type II toxin-antitoxin system VapB family antitoxin [Acidobacteriota bacterium]
MRVRTSLILDDEIVAQIDRIAGEKQRRSIVVETALRQFIAREARVAPPAETPVPAGRKTVYGKR